MISTRLKIYFLTAIIGALVIAFIGYYYTAQDLPPYPENILTEDGTRLTGKTEIMEGQKVWQKYGLMDLGSVWGHGTYRGPDFTAQALNNMGRVMRDAMAMDRFGKAYSELDDEGMGAADAVVIKQIKKNRFDKSKNSLPLSSYQQAALIKNREFYEKLFFEGDPAGPIRANVIKDPVDRKNLADFFFWTAWVAGVERPDENLTYTNNWPNDASVGNSVSAMTVIWSAISIVAFGVVLGLMIFIFHKYEFNKGALPFEEGPGIAMAQEGISSSQRKTAKFFLVVSALFFLQTMVGGLMAHYTVHPSTFYGFDFIAELFTYNWIKSWHLQLAIFWISVSWIGMTLFIAPKVGGKEPKFQGILVDVLFIAILIVAVGSLTGTALGVKGLAGKYWFWLGHQGWEYLELGRLWQILLLVGLLIWLGLVVRALKDHFKPGVDKWGLPHFVAYSGVAVVGFFGFGLLYNPESHLVIADFWRWWVVHTWVEGAFEFFAMAATTFVLVNLGLVQIKAAMRVVYLTAGLALFSGIIGVGHHYFWFGMPSFWLALGSITSALEPVPILLLMSEVWHSQKALTKASSSFPYRYPLMFLMASVIWEFIGAGVMGLSITLPVVNYFEHSTYLTVNHGHTALFGTYGMLSIGLLLFAMRGLVTEKGWDERILKGIFWTLNVGLFFMFTVTLLPIGILQVLDNIKYGFWHARSDAFWEGSAVQILGQIRGIPDTLIIIGSALLVLFMIKGIINLKPVTVKDGEEF